MSELLQKQQDFAKILGWFIAWINNLPGHAVTMGEAFRPQEMADLYVKEGIGIKDSLHTQRLAVDLNLFIDGMYQSDTSAYQELGEEWKSMNPMNRWGGDFSKPDGNHFEHG